jgi:hypothetical protein
VEKCWNYQRNDKQSCENQQMIYSLLEKYDNANEQEVEEKQESLQDSVKGCRWRQSEGQLGMNDNKKCPSLKDLQEQLSKRGVDFQGYAAWVKNKRKDIFIRYRKYLQGLFKLGKRTRNAPDDRDNFKPRDDDDDNH